MGYADDLIGTSTVRDLVRAFGAGVPGLPLPTLAAAAREAGAGTLRTRGELLRRALLADLPDRYAETAAIIEATLRSPVLFQGWMLLPVTLAVATRACEDATLTAYEMGMGLLGALSGRFTSEFAVRPMLRHDLARGLGTARDWAHSPDEDLRRLAVAGTRPHLPGARRVPAILARPHSTVPILDLLHTDPTEYVRRAVADHLADLVRQDPQLAVRTVARWLPDDDVRRLAGRGLRRLVRQGHPEACRLAGVSAPR